MPLDASTIHHRVATNLKKQRWLRQHFLHVFARLAMITDYLMPDTDICII
jgi:hypothetical protein